MAATAGTSAEPLGHRPALDGIRAFAVVAVVLFHAGVPGLGGGFLGVDSFFVLSGFLITSLLLKEHARHNRIALSAFWVRRARRLLPALLAMLIATVVAGRALLDPDSVALLRTDAVAALGYVANWRMIFRGSGYMAATAVASPLQHTWSLGIEEQFYLIWPVVLVGLLAWVPARRARGIMIAGCAAGAGGSALLCAREYDPAAIGRAYFGTDTRAQALLIGAGLAALLAPAAGRPAPPGRAARMVSAAVAASGVAITVVLWHLGSEDARWLYDGGFSLAALATAAIIAHVVQHPLARTTQFLSWQPLTGLGRISYGVYLWHWPLFVFVTSDATGLGRLPLLAVRLLGTLAVALVSYHLIEQPIRHGVLARRLPKRVPAAVTATAVGVTLIAIGLSTAPPPASTAAAAVPVVVAPMRPRPSSPVTRQHRPRGEPRITFFGDSVSWVIGTYLPPHPGLWTSVRAIQGCGIATLPQILELGTPHTNYPGCTRWYDRWRRGVAADQPDVAVIELNRWELMDRKLDGVFQHVGEPGYDAYLTAQLDRAIGVTESRGAAVVLLTAAYTHRAEKPDGSLYPEDQPARVDAWNKLLVAEAAKQPRRVTVLNLTPLVCPHGRFTWSIGGLRVRSDGLHYTPAAVRKIIAPWLLPKLAAIAAGESSNGP